MPAIDSLRLVAEKSEEKGGDELKSGFIEGSVSKAKEEIDSKTLEKLNNDQLTLYRMIKSEGDLKAGELHENVKKEIAKPVNSSTGRGKSIRGLLVPDSKQNLRRSVLLRVEWGSLELNWKKRKTVERWKLKLSGIKWILIPR